MRRSDRMKYRKTLTPLVVTSLFLVYGQHSLYENYKRYSSADDCRACPRASTCTAKRKKNLLRSLDQDLFEEVQAQMRDPTFGQKKGLPSDVCPQDIENDHVSSRTDLCPTQAKRLRLPRPNSLLTRTRPAPQHTVNNHTKESTNISLTR